MKPSEILAALPQWSSAKPDDLVDNPAWALPCRLGETPATLRLDAIRPTDTLDLAIKLEDEPHVLRIADSAQFPELHKVWAARAEIPEPILLALVEKECGPLLQLIENAVRRELSLAGLAKEAQGEFVSARVVSAGNDLATFSITRSKALAETLGQLRYIDLAHPSVREMALPAEIELAAFALSPGDIPETGDALLLPELDNIESAAHVKVIIDGRFAAEDGTGVTPWKDDGRLRAVRKDRPQVPFGAIADFAAEAAAWDDIPPLASAGKLASEDALELMRGTKATASGRLVKIGAQAAFAIDATV